MAFIAYCASDLLQSSTCMSTAYFAASVIPTWRLGACTNVDSREIATDPPSLIVHSSSPSFEGPKGCCLRTKGLLSSPNPGSRKHRKLRSLPKGSNVVPFWVGEYKRGHNQKGKGTTLEPRGSHRDAGLACRRRQAASICRSSFLGS